MKTLFTALLFLSLLGTKAQTKISGSIRDQHGEGLPLANIILLDTYDGTTSDEQGNFEFITSETGPKILVVKFIGYNDFQKEIFLAGKDVVIQATLDEAFNQLEAVSISAGSFTASDDSR